MPDFSNRDFEERAFTIGIGGLVCLASSEQMNDSYDADIRSRCYSPVGSGKTALLLALCRAFRDEFNIGKSGSHHHR